MNRLLTCATRCGAVVALALVACSKAQAPAGDSAEAGDAHAPKEVRTWVRDIPLDAHITAVIELHDGYALAGAATHPDRGDKDMLLIRLDPDGNELWRTTHGGTDKEYAYGLAATNDGGFVISGQTSSFKDYGGDAYVVRTDDKGQEQWANSYGAVGTDTAVAIFPDAESEIFHVLGRTYQGGNGLEIYKLSIDGDGQLIAEDTIGGPDDQYLAAAARSNDGSFLLAGVDGRLNFSEMRPLLIRISRNGETQWKAALEPPGAVHPESVAFLLKRDGTPVYAAGVFEPPDTDLGARPIEREPSDQDIFIAAVNADRMTGWQTTLGASGWDAPRALAETADGGILVAGVTRAYGAGGTDVLLIKLDAGGKEQWAGTIGSTDDESVLTAIATADGGFLVVVERQVENGPQLRLIKLDADGQAIVDGEPIRSDGLTERPAESADTPGPQPELPFLQENAPKVGETAPEINVGQWFNTDKPLTLANLRGKVVVVELWATWCGPCRHSTPHLVELSRKYADQGVVFLGLTDEDPAAAPVEAFIDEFSIPYPVGARSTANVDYGVAGIPTAFVLDEAGVIQWVGHPMDDLAARIDAVLED